MQTRMDRKKWQALLSFVLAAVGCVLMMTGCSSGLKETMSVFHDTVEDLNKTVQANGAGSAEVDIDVPLEFNLSWEQRVKAGLDKGRFTAHVHLIGTGHNQKPTTQPAGER